MCIFFSVTTLLRDSVTKQSKTDSEEHKSKISFQLSFSTTSSHTWCLALNIYAPVHCQLLSYFSNTNPLMWIVNNFSTIELFQQTFENRILVAAKLKQPRKQQETHVWGNPYKARIVLLREVYRFCLQLSNIYILSRFSL